MQIITYPEETRTKILKQMAEQNKALTYNPLAKTEEVKK